MKTQKRVYDSMLAEHLASHRQMAFFTGPRQVGKTPTCGQSAEWQLNWDDEADRELILAGTRNVEAHVGLEDLHHGFFIRSWQQLDSKRRFGNSGGFRREGV